MAVRIDIVGGGIAGLTLAALLDPASFEVVIHEERPERRGLGTALGIWPGARAVLEGIGADDLLKAAVAPTTGSLRLLDGTPCVSMNPSRPVDVRLVARTDLMAALDAAVPASVRRVTDRVVDARDLRGDLVVGADGVFSAVRRSTWGESSAARASAAYAVRGLVPPQPEEVIGEYWGRGRLFGITPVPGGFTNWFCTLPAGEAATAGLSGNNVEKALSLARDRFADGAPAIRAVLDSATPQLTLAGPICSTPAMRRYVRGRVVLIGDAAHAMAPNLGRGACESIIDAGVLAQELARRPLEEALWAYERRRLVPSQAVRVASSQVAAMATAERWALIRDAVLRLGSRTLA